MSCHQKYPEYQIGMKAYKILVLRNLDLWQQNTLLLLVSLLIIILATSARYGDSWDENIRYEAGEKKLAYYENLLTGKWDEARQFGQSPDKYPGFHDLNLAMLRRLSPFSDRITGNLFSAMFGMLTVVGTILLARKLGNSRSGFIAGVLLLTVPSFYGHMFINPKDIPFACGYVWALLAISQWLREDGIPSWKLTVLTGLAIGIATATRMGGLVLLCYLGLFVLTYQVDLILTCRAGTRLEGMKRAFAALTPRAGAVGLIALVILLAYWPYGQMAPFARAGDTVNAISSFDWQMPVLFEGKVFAAPDLPFYYPLKMLGLKIPILTLAAFILGSIMTVRTCGKKVSSHQEVPWPSCFLLFSLLFPIGYIIIRDSVVYNGIRHLLFIVPPICIIAAVAIDRLLMHLEKTRPPSGPIGSVTVAILMMIPVVTMIRLHPYQYIFYNGLAGGTRFASQSYETDYWCIVYKDLADEFIDYLEKEGPAFNRPQINVNMEHVTWLLAPYLDQQSRFPIQVFRSSPQIDDYYISSTFWGADQFYYGKTTVKVERMGIPLGVIKDRRHLSSKERELGYFP